MSVRVCNVEGCNDTHYGRGWCLKHYSRWRRHGTVSPLALSRNPPGLHEECSVGDCSRAHVARGLCSTHYRRWQVRGDVMAGTPVKDQNTPDTCLVADCTKPHKRSGLCANHSAIASDHGIRPEDAVGLFSDRSEECDICTCPEEEASGQGTYLYYDHCHTSGSHRGWLCSNCNLGLGLFKDDPTRLRKAAEYVEEYAS